MNKKEKERLKVLHSYQILDTGVDAVLDSITSLASYICEVPITLISLLDEKRQWFKSKVGLKVSETSRDVAFCNYAVRDKEFLQVKDALADERFSSNPLVTGDPNIRFYAGYPLLTPEGYALGTLCVIDRKPKELNELQKEALLKLSKLVMSYLDKNKQQQDLLEALNAKNNLLSLMSHEIRTPLNDIMGVSNLLNDSQASWVDKKDLTLLKNSSDSLFNIVNELLDSGDMYSGLVKERRILFNLKSLMSELINELKTMEYTLKVNFDLAIPDFLMGDPLRLKQLLRLVLKRFVTDGEPKFNIDIELCDDDESEVVIHFSVGRFDRGPRAEDYDKNSFNVSFVDQIVKVLDAKLEMSDNEACIAVTFDKLQKQEAPEPVQPMQENSLQGVRLLLVEDIETNRYIAGKFLKMWGINYHEAHDGFEAIEMANKNTYDVVLMDLQMPGMNGYEATQEIKTMHGGKFKDLPIIALTASISVMAEDKAESLGLQGYISKPFNPKELNAAIKRALNRMPFYVK